MKAMKLTGLRMMELMDVPAPRIASDRDVLIRMTSVGVCGSDVHYYLDGRIGSQVVEYPFAVGHEGAGIVEEVGPGVTRVKKGDRIAVEPADSCGECDQCLAGRPNTCRKLKFLGCPKQIEGCLSEYMVMPEENCLLLPDSMSFDEAAISEPLAIGLHAVRLSVPMKGARIAILGVGPIGLSVLLTAKALGAEKIYVTDKIDARLEIAKKAGAVWGGNPDGGNVVADILVQEPLQLAAVFECCGEQEAMDQGIELLKPGGKLVLAGIPPTLERVSFKIDMIRRKELCIQNVRRQNQCAEDALEMIARGDVDVKFMVTHRFPLEKTQEAFDLVAAYGDGVIKAMIDIGC